MLSRRADSFQSEAEECVDALFQSQSTPQSSLEHFKKFHHLCNRKRLQVAFFVDLQTDVSVDSAGASTLVRRVTAFRQCTHNNGCLASCVEIDQLRQALRRE